MLPDVPQRMAPGASSARFSCLSFGTCQAAHSGPAIEPEPGLSCCDMRIAVYCVLCAMPSAHPMGSVWLSVSRCYGLLSTPWEKGHSEHPVVNPRLRTISALACSRIGPPSGRPMSEGLMREHEHAHSWSYSRICTVPGLGHPALVQPLTTYGWMLPQGAPT